MKKAGIDIGVNFFLASGYGGQTLETLVLPGEGEPFERITGFPPRSSVTAFSPIDSGTGIDLALQTGQLVASSFP